jgi:DNA (cytosine-5)-methyltransferase 1
MKTKLWFVKVVRSGKRDAYGNLPADIWRDNEVCPTLNAFDNNSASRSTVLIFEATRVEDTRFYEKYSPTVSTYWGTGGARVPYVCAIQGTIIGRSDDAGPQGKGFAEEGNPMYTLDSVSQHGVATETKVRRLTPRECERLQGFPDDWTSDQADSHRYKQLGNAVAVPVVNWIINRMVNQEL